MKIVSFFLLLTVNFFGTAQEIAGKWEINKLYCLNAEADVTDKKYLIKLELNLDSTYVKTLLKYHPFESFSEQLPEVNTLDNESLRKYRREIKSKQTVIGSYIYDPDKGHLTLIKGTEDYTYKATLNGNQLILTDTVYNYSSTIIVLQSYSRIEGKH